MIFGGAGSYADILHDHKSLLFSKEKNLIAFPATLTPPRAANPWVYEPPIFQGLLILGVDEDQQIVLRGHVSHTDWKGDPAASSSGSQTPEWKETRSYDMIRRAAYIGNILYAFSDRQITSASLNDFQIMDSLQLPGYDEMPDDIIHYDNGVVRGSEKSD